MLTEERKLEIRKRVELEIQNSIKKEEEDYAAQVYEDMLRASMTTQPEVRTNGIVLKRHGETDEERDRRRAHNKQVRQSQGYRAWRDWNYKYQIKDLTGDGRQFVYTPSAAKKEFAEGTFLSLVINTIIRYRETLPQSSQGVFFYRDFVAYFLSNNEAEFNRRVEDRASKGVVYTIEQYREDLNSTFVIVWCWHHVEVHGDSCSSLWAGDPLVPDLQQERKWSQHSDGKALNAVGRSFRKSKVPGISPLRRTVFNSTINALQALPDEFTYGQLMGVIRSYVYGANTKDSVIRTAIQELWNRRWIDHVVIV